MHWNDGWGHPMGMMWIWVIVGLLAVAAVVFFLVRGAGSAPARRGRPEDDPETILKQRYARGEIGDEELKRRLEELRGA